MKTLQRILRWAYRDTFEVFQPWSVRVAECFSPCFTANQMTLLGLLLCLPAAVFFARAQLVAGTFFMILSLLTDWFDGALGRYQEEQRSADGLEPLSLERERQLTLFARISFPGVTHLGRSLDPIVDKVRMLIFLFTIGYPVITSWIIWGIIVVGVVLTVIRPLKQKLKLDHVGSNRFGKYKIFVEVAGMGTLIFLSPIHDWPHYGTIVNICFLLALFLGLASLVGHVITGYLTYRNLNRPAGKRTELARDTSQP